MILRGATVKDFDQIKTIANMYDFYVDWKNIELVVVVEIDGVIVAFGSLAKLLEATFLTRKEANKGTRVNALKLLSDQCKIEVVTRGFDLFHIFTGSEMIERTLKKHFGFEDGAGKNLICKVGR